MNTILLLLTFSGLTYFFKESDIFGPVRIWLMSKHICFYNLFQCSFCVGFHIGYLTYIFVSFPHYDIRELLIYGFSSAAISLLYFGLINKLYSE